MTMPMLNLGGLLKPKQPPVPQPQPNLGSTPPVPMPNPQYAGVQTGSFDPSNNLIGTSLTPQTSPDVNAARGQIDQQLGALQGPDRQALAQQTFSALTDQTNPQYQQELRQVGEQAAALGRVGSGVTTSQLGDVEQARQQYLGDVASQLSANAAGQSLNDRLGALQGSIGGLGALSGLDQQNLQNLQGERGYETGLSQQAFNNALAASGLTGPSSAALGIGQNYGQQAQGLFGGAGDVLQLLMRQYGQQPSQPSYGGGFDPSQVP